MPFRIAFADTGRFHDGQVYEVHRLASRSLARIQHLNGNDAFIFRVVNDDAVHLQRIIDGDIGPEFNVQ
ncbi:MAG: hypothetical protein A2W73_08800 [Deltaproteobacteria bacterium RIFCSPLOWO2_12_55_13]|nr:MAG: hypothetical protein A2W73_08800 [Deltaproteobacteria bacterium RIFCSPLOWO2_12_55_13]